MATVRQIYNKLFGGDKLTVRIASLQDFENLRTALVKQNRINKGLGIVDEGVVARYDEDTQLASFQLAIPKRAKTANRWEIVSIDEQTK